MNFNRSKLIHQTHLLQKTGNMHVHTTKWRFWQVLGNSKEVAKNRSVFTSCTNQYKVWMARCSVLPGLQIIFDLILL